MTNEEKIERLAVLISPDTVSKDLASALIEMAEGVVLNRRYPFGIPEGVSVPSAYEHVQLQIAVEMYSKMGAEGQVTHGENGISRSYEAADVSPSLLKRIVPVCGSVM